MQETIFEIKTEKEERSKGTDSERINKLKENFGLD